MTDATPRVDAFVDAGPLMSETIGEYDWGQVKILLNLARQLERELAESAERVREAERKLAEAQKDAVIAWSVCASVHREFCKGRDPLFKRRQADFVKHENDARAALSGAAPEEKKQ